MPWWALGLGLRLWWRSSASSLAPIHVRPLCGRTTSTISSSTSFRRYASSLPLPWDQLSFVLYWCSCSPQAIPQMMAGLRTMHGICPPEVLTFILDLFKYNDNSKNKVDTCPINCVSAPIFLKDWQCEPLSQYSDNYYRASLIDALAESVTPAITTVTITGYVVSVFCFPFKYCPGWMLSHHNFILFLQNVPQHRCLDAWYQFDPRGNHEVPQSGEAASLLSSCDHSQVFRPNSKSGHQPWDMPHLLLFQAVWRPFESCRSLATCPVTLLSSRVTLSMAISWMSAWLLWKPWLTSPKVRLEESLWRSPTIHWILHLCFDSSWGQPWDLVLVVRCCGRGPWALCQVRVLIFFMILYLALKFHWCPSLPADIASFRWLWRILHSLARKTVHSVRSLWWNDCGGSWSNYRYSSIMLNTIVCPGSLVFFSHSLELRLHVTIVDVNLSTWDDKLIVEIHLWILNLWQICDRSGMESTLES